MVLTAGPCLWAWHEYLWSLMALIGPQYVVNQVYTRYTVGSGGFMCFAVIYRYDYWFIYINCSIIIFHEIIIFMSVYRCIDALQTDHTRWGSWSASCGLYFMITVNLGFSPLCEPDPLKPYISYNHELVFS